MRFSRTVRRLKIRRPSGTCATPRPTISWGGTPTSDAVSSVIVPERGWRRPEIALSVVVFPAPLLPRSATISPRPTSSPTPLSARISPYATSSASTLSTAGPPGGRAARAEVRPDDPCVALDLARRPLRDLLARVEHGHPVGYLHHDAHVVLDQDDREPEIDDELAQEAHERAGLGLVRPGGGHEGKGNPGLGRERGGGLEPALVAVREIAGHVVGARPESDAVEQRHRARRELRLGPAEARAMREDVPQAERDPRVHADEDVLDDRHVREEPDVLKRPTDPQRGDLVGAEAEERSLAEGDAAVVGGVEPREDVEERRLPRAVRPDDRRDARLEREVHRLQRGEAAEPLGHASGLEEDRHLAYQVGELPLPPPCREDPLGAEDHHEDQDDAEDHALVLGRLELRRQVGEAIAEDGDTGVLQLVEPERQALQHLEVEDGHDRGAEHGARNGAHPSEDHHGQDADRLEKRERLRVDEHLLGREHHAHDAREGGAAREGQELHPHERHPHRPRRQLVLADRLPGPADVRVLEPAVGEDDHDHDEQDEKVEVLAIGQPERRGRAGDRRDALRTVREVDGLVEVVGEHADHLAEAERDDGEVVAVQAEHREAEEDPGDRRHEESDEQEGEEPRAGQGEPAAAEDDVGVRRAEDGPGIRADGEERDVAEVEQARQADDDVEAERQRREDPDLRRHLEVVAVEGPDQGHQQQQGDPEEADPEPRRDPCQIDEEQRALEREEGEDRAWRARDGEAREGDGGRGENPVKAHARSRTISPSRPLGRKMRITMSIEKAKMSLYSAPNAPPVRSDRYEAAKASRSPRTRPPSIAPGMLPMPPSTAAVKAFNPGMNPV